MAELTHEGVTQTRARGATRRIEGIDAGRVLMAFLVVSLHSLPRSGTGASIIGMVCRCAVPFFLIASGYLQNPPERFAWDVLSRPLRRLLPIYLFWMAVYYAVAGASGIRPVHLDVRDLISGGTAFHLWFLPALGGALVLVPVGVLVLGRRATGLACAALAAAAIAFSTYHDVLHLPGSARRGGLMVAPLLVFIGHWLARHRLSAPLPAAAALAVSGFAFMLCEELWIGHRLGLPLDDHDFSIGTFAYGAGVFLFARALPAGSAVGRLAPLGTLALGIYVTHVLFIWGLAAVLPGATLSEMAWRVPIAFFGALLLTVALRKIPILRRTVA
jgi:surface polysaccharide O-acyltransferase-like enzyme